MASVLCGKTLTIACPQGSIKQQDTTVHTPPRTAKLQNTWWHQRLEQWEPHWLLTGMQNGTAASEDRLLTSYKITYILTIWSKNCITWHLYERIKKWCSHKTPHEQVVSALWVIDKTWKQLRHPSVSECVSKLSISKQWNVIQTQRISKKQPWKYLWET